MKNMIISAVLVLMTPVSALAQLPPEIDPSEVCQPELQGQGCWMELESHPGCYVWTQWLESEAAATWTGKCAGGRIQGTGTVTWKWVSPSGKTQSHKAKQYPCDQWTKEMYLFFEYAVPQHVRNCLAAGADPNARGEFERTPLHYARGRSVQILLEAGADPNARDKFDITPLSCLASNGRSGAALHVLLEAGADVHARDVDGLTALHNAGSSGDPSVIQIFLQEGLRVGVRDERGNTPLHEAASPGLDSVEAHRRTAEAVKILIAAGADVHARREDGKTPLHQSVFGSPAAVKVLLAAGADPNARDEDGVTPLHRLVELILIRRARREARGIQSQEEGDFKDYLVSRFKGNVDPRNELDLVITALLAGGADPNARDEEGRTPWDLVQAIDPRTLKLLRSIDAYWTLNDAHFQKPGLSVTVAEPEKPEERAETEGKCEIPGYMEAHRSGNAQALAQTIDWKNLGLPWCSASVDLQVRSIALKIAVAECGLATSEGAAPEKIQTRQRQIRESCAQLKALGRRLGIENCQCPPGGPRKLVSRPDAASEPVLPSEATKSPDRKRNLPTCADGDTVPINVAEGKKPGCPPSQWCAWDACQGDRECRSAYPECEPGVLQ